MKAEHICFFVCFMNKGHLFNFSFDFTRWGIEGIYPERFHKVIQKNNMFSPLPLLSYSLFTTRQLERAFCAVSLPHGLDGSTKEIWTLSLEVYILKMPILCLMNWTVENFPKCCFQNNHLAMKLNWLFEVWWVCICMCVCMCIYIAIYYY